MCTFICFCFFKRHTAYEMRVRDWSSDVCSSDLRMFRARLLGSRGAMLIRLDRYADAGDDYDAPIALLERHGSPVELGKALNGRGVTRSSQGRFEQALADLDRKSVV